VALYHFSGQLNTSILQPIAAVGWLGVDIFFVISGFVIPYTIFGRHYSIADFPRFMLRRLVRLEPPYLLSILMGIILWHAASMVPGFLGSEPTYTLPQVAFHLFYAIPLTQYGWLSPVYWTLAYEFVFYILVGLFFPFLICRGIVWTVCVGTVIVVGFSLWSAEIDVRILEFILGAVAMRLVCQSQERRSAEVWLAILIAIVFAVGGVKIGIACLLTVMLIVVMRRQVFGPWALAIGSISYSLYLTHGLIGGRVINLGKRFGEGAAYDVGLVLLALAASVAFANLFSRVVEKPAIAASRTIRLHKILA
jgi:peptidoglycan/LPS O-acetylase OafA/YrhL